MIKPIEIRPADILNLITILVLSAVVLLNNETTVRTYEIVNRTQQFELESLEAQYKLEKEAVQVLATAERYQVRSKAESAIRESVEETEQWQRKYHALKEMTRTILAANQEKPNA